MGPALGQRYSSTASRGPSPSSVFLEALNINVEETICREAEGAVFYKLQPDELCNNTKRPWRVTIIQILNEKSFMAVVKAKSLIYI